jgi:RNA polymerase sigma factor (sigma-70 family)
MNANQIQTIDLLADLRAGTEGASERIVEHVYPPLMKFASGRLPRHARGMHETQDLVQDVLIRAMPRMRSFDAAGQGALLAYLKRALINQVIDEVRKATRRRSVPDALEALPDPAPLPLEQATRREQKARFRSALSTLSPLDQVLIVERVREGRRYAEIAERIGNSNANAVRVAVSRALARLARALSRQAAERLRDERGSVTIHAGDHSLRNATC